MSHPYSKLLFITFSLIALLAASCVPIQPASQAGAGASEAAPVSLRLAVALTPQELETFQAAITALDEAHPEWEIVLEAIPQQSVIEKINTQLAANDLPDVFRTQGLQAQQW